MKKFFVAMVACVMVFSASSISLAKEMGLVGMANPTSVFCSEGDGSTIISSNRNSGGEYGICVFPNGFAIEEWTLYRIFNPAEPELLNAQ